MKPVWLAIFYNNNLAIFYIKKMDHASFFFKIFYILLDIYIK